MNPHSNEPFGHLGSAGSANLRSSSKIVEKQLARARLRWNWLRFVRCASILGIVLSLLALLLGSVILSGFVTTQRRALTLLSILGVAGLLGWSALLTSVLARAPSRDWLARSLERVDRRLQDRLNTLLFLESAGSKQIHSASFLQRIRKQAERVLNDKLPPSPFSSTDTLALLASFVIVLACALWLNQRFAPWARLRAASVTIAGQGRAPDPFPQLALPATNNVEQNQPWGEVRITDPGTDLKLTKVDVVPLAIEAAANRDLKTVTWCSSVNGTQEQTHELPSPPDPRYATYQPTIYLDQLGLSDWDVMTYYARAATVETNHFASQVYFLEIRPFREDIAKLPGGQGGQAYATLNEMTSLIDRQQGVIRETHQHVQSPPAQENARNLDRQKLAQAESDLGGAAQHLYAEMAAKMENKPIGDALDNLAKAQVSLGDASGLLQSNVLAEAQNRERAALSELVAARKVFQKAVSDHPGDFSQPNQAEEVSPVADSSKKLSEMAEFRDEAKTAQEYVQKTLDQQKNLEQQARSGSPEQGSQLASEQEALGTNLNDFAEQHPRAFKGTEEQSKQAVQAMKRAAELMREKADAAAGAAQEAAKNLEKLKIAMQAGAANQQLADDYRLKQMLDQAIQALAKQAKTNANGKGVPEELTATVRTAQQTIDELKKAIDQQSAGKAFGQPLRDALSESSKADLDEKLDALSRAQTDSERQERAGAAQAGLERLAAAFAASEPKFLQAARKTDWLKPDSVEPSTQLAAKDNQPNLLNIDPARLPGAYRGRIEKYFRKLSEE